MIHDFENYNPHKLPFIPHLDFDRKLKVMIYLSDVSASDGPIYFRNCNIETFEKKTLSLKKDYKLNQLNEINDYKINEYKPCIGDAGSVIFFDTNCPHFAGQIENKSNQRKILRFNYVYKKNKFLNLIKKLKNKLLNYN